MRGREGSESETLAVTVVVTVGARTQDGTTGHVTVRHVTARDNGVTPLLGIDAATLFTAAAPIIDDMSAATDSPLCSLCVSLRDVLCVFGSQS